MKKGVSGPSIVIFFFKKGYENKMKHCFFDQLTADRQLVGVVGKLL